MFFLGSALILRSLEELPGDLEEVCFNAILLLAATFFVWSMSHALFCEGRIAETVFGMSRRTARDLRRFWDRVFVLLLLLMFVPTLLEMEPFRLYAIPRLGSTAFGLTVLLPLALLLKSSSPVGEAISRQLRDSFVARNWGLLVTALMVLLLGAVCMGIMDAVPGDSFVEAR